MNPDEHVHEQDIDAAVEEMIKLRDSYEETQRHAHKIEDESLYFYAKDRKNAVQECINIMVSHDLY